MPIGMPLPCVLFLFNIILLKMFSKVKTIEDALILFFGVFLFFIGMTAFLAIASVIVKMAEQLDKLMF